MKSINAMLFAMAYSTLLVGVTAGLRDCGVPQPTGTCAEQRESLRVSTFDAFNGRRNDRDSLNARVWQYLEICECKGE